MTDTVNLRLPCIEGSQAQKHVTHNDALHILDTLVQLAVLDRDLTAPPGSLAEGQRWIVKATATGAWSGHDHAIAAWQDGVWQFSPPQTGWLAYVIDEGALVAWNGGAWVAAIEALTPSALNNMTLLGVGTTADASNPLSAKLNNSLFVAKTVAEGGDGNLRYKLSKESAAKTLSFLFQNNFSGRAEIGLTGDDDFHVKVSADGSSWVEAIKVDRTTGRVSFPASGIVVRGQLAGLAVSRNATTPNTKLDIAAGQAADAANAVCLTVASPLTLDIAATGANGLDATGTRAANATVHVFVIAKPDGSVAAFGAATTAPTLPSGYSYRRRVASLKLDASSNFRAFTQGGDRFIFDIEMFDIGVTNLGTSLTSYTLSTPAGIKPIALIKGFAYNASSQSALLILSPDQPDQTINVGSVTAPAAGYASSNYFEVRTNASSQIAAKANAAGTTFYLTTVGWIDRRGRDD